MRRFGLVVAFVVGLIGLGTAPVLAQSAADVPVCAGVQLLSPADGAELEADYRVKFTWSAEPKGTASRDWVSIRLGADKNGIFSIADGTHAKADRGQYKAFARGRPGLYTWFVAFKDAKGKVICMSKSRTYVVSDDSSSDSLMAQASNPAVTVTVSKGRYVVHLMGFRGTDNTTGYAGGVANWEKPGDSYIDAIDGTGAHDWKAMGYDGLDVWGNGDVNFITGSDQNDRIHGLGGTDIILGGKGDDLIDGGADSDGLLGEEGNDTILGGAGDDGIAGGPGDDTIDAGPGSDVVDGGPGTDTCTNGEFVTTCP